MANLIPAWQLIYGGINITGNLVAHAEHVDYSEAIGGKASVLEVMLEDSSKAFQNNPPTAGKAVSLSIGYQSSGAPNLTNCGLFEVDEWEFEGPPDKFKLRAIQAGITRPIRTVKSFAWEGQSLTSIASTIAGRYGMTTVVDAVTPDVIYQRVTQRLENDLQFLHRVANMHNYDFNIRGNQMVFYSRPQLESKPPPTGAAVIDKTNVIKFRIHKQHVGKLSYQACAVTYFDPLSKQLLSALATDPVNNSTSKDTLKIVERIENQQQATLRAQAHLHSANMQQIKGEIVIPGTMLYRAGNTVSLSGFGAFDSVKFIVQEAKHRLRSDGYRTALEIRTTITGNASQLISDEFGG
jgi:phage protein D